MNKKERILTAVSKQIQKEVKTLGRCKRIAELGQELLAKEGITTILVKGSAAWRVGVSELAYISFIPLEELPEDSYYIGNEGQDRFHYWLEDEDGKVVDFSSFTFRRLVASIDKMEGITKRTGVTWCPDYLYLKKKDASSLNGILNGKRDKMFYYKTTVSPEAGELLTS